MGARPSIAQQHPSRRARATALFLDLVAMLPRSCRSRLTARLRSPPQPRIADSPPILYVRGSVPILSRRAFVAPNLLGGPSLNQTSLPEISALLGSLRGMPAEQLLDLTIARLRAALPAGPGRLGGMIVELHERPPRLPRLAAIAILTGGAVPSQPDVIPSRCLIRYSRASRT